MGVTSFKPWSGANLRWAMVAVAILAPVTGVFLASNPVLFGAVALVMIAAFAFLRWPQMLLFAVMVSFGISYRTLLDYRIFVGDWPVGLYDIAPLLLLMAILLALRHRRKVEFLTTGNWLMIVYTGYFILVGIPNGLFGGASITDVMQSARSVLYGLIGFEATLLLIGGDDEILSIVFGGIVGGVLAVTQILWFSYTNIFASAPGVIMRDYYLPGYSAVMGFCLLGGLWVWYPALLRHWGTLLLLIAMVGGILLFNTRVCWFMTVAAIVTLVWFAARSRRVYQKLIVVAISCMAMFFLLRRTSPYFAEAIYQILVRLNMTFTSGDETWHGRLRITDANVREWADSPVSVIFGRGWGSMDSHSGYTFMLGTGGLIGFTLFLCVVAYFLFHSVRALRIARTNLHRAVASALIASLVACYVSVFSSGGFLSWITATHWGMLCGLAELLSTRGVVHRQDHNSI
jgi:hypothetical protein